MAENIPGANPSPEVAARPLPTPYDETRAPPGAFGEGVGDELQRSGHVLDQVASEYQQRANAVAIEGAFGRAQQALNNIILDPKQGFLALKGQDALSKADTYTDRFRKALDTVRGSLQNDAQRREIGFRLDRLQESGLRLAASHERGQHDVIAEASFRGAEKATTDTIAQLAGDPGTPPTQMREAMKDLIEQARNRAVYRYGRDPPADAVKFEALPLLNSAAVTAMSEAVATGDPRHAADTLMLFGPYLGAHAKLYTGTVNKMLAQQAISRAAEQVIGGAAAPVALPDGTVVAHLDAGKIDAGLAKLKADDPHAADIAKAVDERQKRLDDTWKKTVAQQVMLAQQEGDPTAVGDFQMDKVSPARRQWLQQNDEDALIKLGSLQRREDASQRRANLAELRATSAENTSAAKSWVHDDDNKDAVLKMSRAEMGQRLLDDSLYPGGFQPGDRTSILAEFDKVQKRGTKLDEKPAQTVKDAIAEAFSDDPFSAKAFRDKYFGPLLDKANAYVAQHKGEVNTEKLRKYVESELAYGKVKGTVWIFDSSARRIEAQMTAAYAGKRFAVEGEPEEVLGAEPAAATAPQIAPLVAPAAVVPIDTRPARTVNGVTKHWNGKSWE